MEIVKFNKILEDQLEMIKSVFSRKRPEYASDVEVFSNFEKSVGLSFTTSREKVAWEFAVKHFQSIKDLIETNEKGGVISDDLIHEKFTDAINYLILIKAMLLEKK